MTEKNLHDSLAGSGTEFDPKSIGVATATYYPKWSASRKGSLSVELVRGDLSIDLAKKVLAKGYQFVVVDGGSSDEFKSRLEDLGVRVQPELHPGMSPGRRQAFREVSNLPGVRVICWTEPEKVSFIDCLYQSAVPIFSGEADVVNPKRDQEAFSTYPADQVVYERKQSDMWNKILRARKLLPQDAEDLDMTFGPKLFINRPEVLGMFMKAHRFQGDSRLLYQNVHPELWSDATIFPLITALHEGKRVISVTVPYRHPAEQTRVEADRPEMRRKRVIQYQSGVISTTHFVRNLENNPLKPSRLITVSSA